MLLQFPVQAKQRHGRASTSSRAASLAMSSAERPTARASSVATIGDHHSGGILSRRRHLESIEMVGGFEPGHCKAALAPIAAIAALTDGQSAVTSVKEFGLVMLESHLGQIGLDGKANTAHDAGPAIGDNAAMAERLSETEEKLAFIRRVRLARMARFETQEPICTILGISQGVYKHYEKRSALPHRFIPKFVAATGVDYKWLLSGEGKGPATEEFPPSPARKPRAVRQKQRAA